jgi:hypothetical protein
MKKPEFMQEWDRINKTDRKIFNSLPKRWRAIIYLMFFTIVIISILWVISYIQINTKI